MNDMEEREIERRAGLKFLYEINANLGWITVNIWDKTKLLTLALGKNQRDVAVRYHNIVANEPTRSKPLCSRKIGDFDTSNCGNDGAK